MRRPTAAFVALAAVMIVVTTVFTLLVRIPVPATQGYVNFSDVAVYLTAFALGPWAGLVAGGVGTALADVLGGYAQFAPLSLLAHGLQGWVAGVIARPQRPGSLMLAWLVGTGIMVSIYFWGEGQVLATWPAAVAEAPFNLLQNVVGGLVGTALFYAVRAAYPPVTQLGRRQSWHEDAS